MSTPDRPPLKVDLRQFSTNEGLPLGDNKGRGFVTRGLWMLVNAIVFRTSFVPAYEVKARLLRLFGAEIGEGVILKPGIHVNRPWNLKIGDHCWIGEAVWLDCTSKLRIGNHVVISQGAFLCCGMHDWQDPGMGSVIAPITVEDGAWIAAFSRIAGNVTTPTGCGSARSTPATASRGRSSAAPPTSPPARPSPSPCRAPGCRAARSCARRSCGGSPRKG